ncbi:cyclin-dependent kinase inhibitor 1-like isoform X2 [Copidosoma floridanum]|uniref:cyclin-dependent kinase inhibitor 1-like isoform X2 n=1 Tax=Copidosoma floridanum TaxID=29053 RepID=UPI0006C98775|nr:cyclin-dependent kinase inhibitor 1-like isoform X2 [Copidosoma floridanum]
MKELLISARLAMAETNPDSQEAKLKSVRKRLNFGDTNDDNLPTKEELERKFEEERRKELEEKKAKWNFDFKEGHPIEGRWEWMKVEQPNGNKIPRSTGIDGEKAEIDVENPAQST